VSLREDGPAALDWVASYLERVRDLPALAQVSPGEIRAALPVSPPEQGEEFAAVLRDLDDLLLRGLTHWQSPRFFAYFSTTGSEAAILADLLAAGLNQVGILWRTSPALQELEEVTLGWLADLLGLPSGWHGHLEQGASVATLGALAAAREAKPGHVLASEHAHSSVERACRLLGMELRKVGVDDGFRLRPEALDLDGASVLPPASGCTSTRPTRARRWSVRSCAGRSRASRASTRWS
jgi:aromatic-L-amino-acid decarboxylase